MLNRHNATATPSLVLAALVTCFGLIGCGYTSTPAVQTTTVSSFEWNWPVTTVSSFEWNWPVTTVSSFEWNWPALPSR